MNVTSDPTASPGPGGTSSTHGARDAVLGRIRAALGSDRVVPDVVRDYRTTSHLDDQAVVDRFAEVVDDYRATVHRCRADELPGVVSAILARAGTTRVAAPAGVDGTWLSDVAPEVTILRDGAAAVVPSADDAKHDESALDVAPLLAPDDLDAVDAVLTGSAVAIAETGTIVLDASPDQGRRALTLVPDHHVCVVPAERIVATVPEALARLDPRRPLTMISGPSATSDIELDRVEGVHGPRVLDVVVVEPPAAPGHGPADTHATDAAPADPERGRDA